MTPIDFVGEIVDKAFSKRDTRASEKSVNGRYVFLHELVQQTSDPIRIRSELLNILIAGRDTTAALLTNVWFLLAQRPDVHAILASDIASHVGYAKPPTYQQIQSMKYLRAVLNESLRLYPIIPGNSREAAIDTVLPVGGGPDGQSPVFVAQGDSCSYYTSATQKRKDLYGDDAEEFRPERWLDMDGKKGLRPGWGFLPFGGGARVCIGRESRTVL